MNKLLLITSLVVLGVLGVTACSPQQEPITPTRDDPEFTMKVEVISANKITEVCEKLGVKYDANGCAAFDRVDKHCTIYVVAPRHADDTERFAVIGHETWHCRYGAWHK